MKSGSEDLSTTTTQNIGESEDGTEALESHTSGAAAKKRRRIAVQSQSSSGQHTTPKGRACTACKKLKVKCDRSERVDGVCSRCLRLGIECFVNVAAYTTIGERHSIQAAVSRLDKAVEDVLTKLKMAPLQSYGKLPTPDVINRSSQQQQSGFYTTRENSQDLPNEAETEIAHAPMGSLFEVTQLRSLRSRLRRRDPNSRGSKWNMENDLISQGQIKSGDADEMFDLFKRSLSRYLFATTVSDDATLSEIRKSSTLLLTAILVVATLHIPSKSHLYAICHAQFLDLVAASMFDKFHTLEDIRALCIGAFWLPDLSWKLSGHCIRMATELNLHQAFYQALHSAKLTTAERKQAFERARIWYLLYVLDHHFSIAYGRPPVTAELQPIQEYEAFISAPECLPSDHRIISQVSLFLILSRAYATFGLESERLMDDGDITLHNLSRYNEDLDRWRHRWERALSQDAYVGDYPGRGLILLAMNFDIAEGAIGVVLHYHFAKLQLNSLTLRGRSLSAMNGLPWALRPMARDAIESAHSVLQTVLDEPSLNESLVGVPLYLHATIAFAVVFLIKMSPRWRSIGISIDPSTRTVPLIQRIVVLLKRCNAGSNHILYSMAAGFEKLLGRNNAGGNKPGIPPAIANGSSSDVTQTERPNSHSQQPPQMYQLPSLQPQPVQTYNQSPSSRNPYDGAEAATFDATGSFPDEIPGVITMPDWQDDNEILWNVDYDLVNPSHGENVASFPFYDLLQSQEM